MLLYHYVLAAKYRRAVFSKDVDVSVKEICLEISKRYEIHFLEIGMDRNHLHLLVQLVPTYSPTRIVTIIKSITAGEIFRLHPQVKKRNLWILAIINSSIKINFIGIKLITAFSSAELRLQKPPV